MRQFSAVIISTISFIFLYSLLSHAYAQSVVYVTEEGSPDASGSEDHPFHLVESGVERTATAGTNTVSVGSGTYYESLIISDPVVLTAPPGEKAVIGERGQNSILLDMLTLNTHLAGDDPIPSWYDYERAEDIAHWFGDPHPEPDVVAFQEIWDEDLFKGGDGAEGVLPLSGYPHGRHGELENLDPLRLNVLNSGLALMSKYPLSGFLQVEYLAEAGFFEPLAAKGWIQATIMKDGFSIGLFNTHTQADYSGSDYSARSSQVRQLSLAIKAYRQANPGHAVFAMGDFNIYGGYDEYFDVLIFRMGAEADGKDGARNAPGYYSLTEEEQWTYCSCNPLAYYFDDEALSGRLDYIFYFPSLDGTVTVLPERVEVMQFLGTTYTTIGPETISTNQSSDHWAVYGRFKLVRK